MRGRKPLPLAIRRIEGNVGHRRIPNVPEAELKLPKPPRELSREARRMWRRLGAKLAALGVVAEVDEAGFAVLCQAYADWLDLIKQARKDGSVVKINGQPVRNPYLTGADREAEKIRRLLPEFGCTPAGRVRLIGITKPMDDPAAEIHRFMRLAK
jgi:P27 family predicted phage terminase small subunit